MSVEQFERDGYAIFKNIVDRELVAEASAHVEWLQRRNPDLRPEALGHRLMRDDPFWVRLVGDDRLLDVAAQFVGPDIALFASHYISKPAFSGQPVLWHQDAAYWPLEPMNVVSLWLAVDHSTPANGGLRVIPGSHKRKIMSLRERGDVANVLGSEIAVENVDETHAVDLVLAPGDISVHHPNIIHGSKSNTSPDRRCGLTIRYIPTSTRILDDDKASAFLLRGDAISSVNTYRPRPRYVQDQHMPFRGCERWA